MNLQNLKDKKILLVGFEKTNQAFFRVLRKHFPNLRIGIADLNPKVKTPDDKNVEMYLGENYLDKVEQFDLIVRSPGVPIKSGLAKVEERLTTATQLFFDEVRKTSRAKIIGITGTKGKSTSSTLLFKILEEAGKKVFLVGNIDIQDWDTIEKITDDSLIVYELSSYMLHAFTGRPDIAIWLNIYDDHLSWHNGSEAYTEAKSNICLNQNSSDTFIYNEQDEKVASFTEKCAAKKIPFNSPDGVHMENSFIMEGNEKILSTKEIALRGSHNWENILAVITAAKILDVPKEAILKILQSFSGLAHRLETVATVNNIEYVDDLLATNPDATIAAIKSFQNLSCLILGGKDRGYEYSKLGKEIKNEKIEHIVLLPGCREKIKACLKNYQGQIHETETIEESVKICAKNARPSSVVLLSPAAPSYDQFKNYKEKGKAFRSAIERIGVGVM